MLPAFQAQNPAISGYSLGWSSCTAFSAAMVGSYELQQTKAMTGGEVRHLTGDTEGGLNLAQVDGALNEGWNVDLSTYYRWPWDHFAAAIRGGKSGILQVLYAPIAASRFDAGNGFVGAHAIAVMPGFVTMDPLADGRHANVYHYHGEAYPEDLLKIAAGRLPGSAPGLVYAAMSHAHGVTGAPPVVDRYRVVIHPEAGTRGYPKLRYFGVYTVRNGVIIGSSTARTGGFSADCTPPRLYRWNGHTSQTLVRITSGSRAGLYVRHEYADEV